MKIAYLILCHTDPEHIGRLVNKLTDDECHAFVHVDKKYDEAPFREKLKFCSKVKFIEDRICVYWGGFSAVQATITLMKAALEYDAFDRFVLLQGLEYPIKSNVEIKKFFVENRDREFICAQNISKRNDARTVHKYRLYHFPDKSNKIIGKLSKKINRKLLKMDFIHKLKSRTVKNKNGSKMELYQGCAQIALTRDAVEYVVRFFQENRKANKYFKTVFTVDEIYFHTLIFNSKFRENATEISDLDFPRLRDFKNLTYFEYPADTVDITVFKDKSDYEKLNNSGYLFVRKVNSESKALLDYIDYCHLNRLE